MTKDQCPRRGLAARDCGDLNLEQTLVTKTLSHEFSAGGPLASQPHREDKIGSEWSWCACLYGCLCQLHFWRLGELVSVNSWAPSGHRVIPAFAARAGLGTDAGAGPLALLSLVGRQSRALSRQGQWKLLAPDLFFQGEQRETASRLFMWGILPEPVPGRSEHTRLSCFWNFFL